MKTSLNTLLLFLLSLTALTAQRTGLIEYKTLGVRFTVPNGWVGQENGDLFLMGSNSIPGIALMTMHEGKSLQEMQVEMQKGIQEGNGTNLSIFGEIDQLSNTKIGATLEGTIEFQPVKAYLIGMLNPNGKGVLIMTATTPQIYNDTYKKLAQNISGNVQFFQPILPPVVGQWKEKLQNVRLTYMYSYTSMDYSNPNITTGGGTSTETKIELCSKGYFNYNSSSFTSLENSAVMANSINQGQGEGSWTVTADASGSPVLQLNFYNGEVYEYTLSNDGSKTLLNGKRYFLTRTGQYAPNCY